MGRIDQDYSTDATITGTDKVIGTDAADGSTKNYTIDGIKGYMEGNLTGASDSYTSLDGKTVTSVNGLTTSIATATIATDATVTANDLLRGVDSADGVVKNYTVESIKDYTSANLDVDNLVYTVHDNIVMNNTTDSSTTVLDYGVNVIRTSTATNYACKLPQPVTGKKVTVVNKSLLPIKIFPSNIGGQINNYPIDSPATVPNDGRSYEFICTVNPLPGNWSWNPPNASLYDSGEITAVLTSDHTTGYRNPKVSAVDTNTVVVGNNPNNGFEVYSWGYNGRSLPNVINEAGKYVAFRTNESWLSINRILIQTNCVDNIEFRLNVGYSEIYYATANTGYGFSNGDIITNGVGSAGPANQSNITKRTISGSITNPSDTFQPNIGDPGTTYYEADIAMPAPVIGKLESGPIGLPFDANYFGTVIPQGTETEFHTSGYISLQIQPAAYTDYGTETFKYRFFIEYTV